MNARFDDHGTLCIVSLEGEFIGDAVDPVRTACLDRVDSGVRDLILDLSSTEMVDSAGLEAMLALADAAVFRALGAEIAALEEPLPIREAATIAWAYGKVPLPGLEKY